MASQSQNVSDLFRVMSEMFPDILTGTHSVPPMFFNQVPCRRILDKITGLPANLLHEPIGATRSATPRSDLTSVSLQPVPSPPSSLLSLELTEVQKRVKLSQVSDDKAQEQLLRNMQELGRSRKEAMFIISHLEFTGDRVGDFDLLVISRQRGILVGEMKPVGEEGQKEETKFEVLDKTILTMVKKAMDQLKKLKEEVSARLSDIASGKDLPVRTTIILPFVSREQLRRVFTDNPHLAKSACNTLGAADAAQAADLCLCSDQLLDLSERTTVTQAELGPLDSWWQRRMDHTEPQMDDNTYIGVVAKFVGPATSVEVQVPSSTRLCVNVANKAIASLGHMLSTLILTPQQVDLLDGFSKSSLHPLVYLSGPPGTGKTVLLTLVGLCRLRRGKDVQVVNGHRLSGAASRLLKNQMELTLSAVSGPPNRGQVFLRDYDLMKKEEMERAVQELTALGPDVFLVFDEVACGLGFGDLPRYFRDLLKNLEDRIPTLGLWAASIHHSIAPQELAEMQLSIGLRSAPSVLREVQEQITGWWSKEVHPYDKTLFRAAADGMPVERLVHEKDNQNGHSGVAVEDCFLCGQKVAAVLRNRGIGDPGSEISQKDVFILSAAAEQLRKDVTGQAAGTTDCRLVQGVREAGFDVHVMVHAREDKASWDRDIDQVAKAAQDSIIAADYDFVHGLERKVVVVLNFEDPQLMLLAASRATTQLVLVSYHSQ